MTDTDVAVSRVLVRLKGYPDPVPVEGRQVWGEVFAGPPGGSGDSERDWARASELLLSTPLMLLLEVLVLLIPPVVVAVVMVEGKGPG